MNIAPRPNTWRNLLLAALFLLSLYYLYRAVNYRFVVPGRMGPPNPISPGWYFVHVLFALPVLLGAPLQFISELRLRKRSNNRTLLKMGSLVHARDQSKRGAGWRRSGGS
jgi:hypothetical protein